MIDWIAAYNRLHKFLDTYKGSDFIRIVQETDPDLLDYNDYIKRRQDEGKSTTKKDYFKDILLSYPDDIKHHLFEVFLEKFEKSSPEDVKDIRTILKGGKVDIRKTILNKAVASKEVDQNLMTDTLSGLEAYPDASKLYQQSVTGLKSGKETRHVLDDLRLSVEYFLRALLKNDKTLENQISPLANYQKEKGISPEIISTFQKLLDLFAKYQNNYVKHHDKAKDSEVEFIFNLANTLFRFLLSH